MSKRNHRYVRHLLAHSCFVSMLLLFSTFAVNAQTPGDLRVRVGWEPMAELGTTISLPIMFESDDPQLAIGGFDLLLEFDTAAVSFAGASAGRLLNDCGWGSPAVTAVSSNLVRLAATAGSSPTCHLEGSSDTLLVLSFDVDTDTLLDCTVHPVQFYWQDCGDNTFTNQTGSDLYLSNQVIDWPSEVPIQEDDAFPTIKGAPDACLGGAGVSRLVDFYDGGISMLCSDSLDERGDVNLNGIPYELVDWSIFRDYFVYGPSAFTIDVDRQIATTDINNDGYVLTIRDLVYLQRVIIGDANPFPKQVVLPADTARFLQGYLCPLVHLNYGDSLGTIYLVFDGITTPTLIPEGFDLAYARRNDSTYVLISPTNLDKTSLGSGDILSYLYDPVLAYAEVGDYQNTLINTRISMDSLDCVKLYVDDVSIDLPDTAFQMGVYLQTPVETISGFVVQISFDDPYVLNFDMSNPVVYGEAVTNWDYLEYNDLGTGGRQLRVVGLANLPEPPGTPAPIMPGPERQLLFTLNAAVVDTMLDTLCGFNSAAKLSTTQVDFSNPEGDPLFWGGKNGAIDLRCPVCGDLNSDGIANISDVVYYICWIFAGCANPEPIEVADADCNSVPNIADAVYLLDFIFGGGDPPCAHCN